MNDCRVSLGVVLDENVKVAILDPCRGVGISLGRSRREAGRSVM